MVRLKIPHIHLQLLCFLVSLFWLAGCLPTEGPYPPHHIIALDDSKKVDVEIVLYKGNLNIASQDKPALLVGEFDYQTATQKPEVIYERKEFDSRLLVDQVRVPTIGVFPRKIGRNQWNLSFYNKIPMSWILRLGDVNGMIDLNDLDVQWMKLDMKTGSLVIDLRNNAHLTRNVWINPGEGDVQVFVPKTMGVQIEESELSGVNVFAEGFEHKDNYFRNAAFGQTEATLFIGITGDKGDVAIMTGGEEL